MFRKPFLFLLIAIFILVIGACIIILNAAKIISEEIAKDMIDQSIDYTTTENRAILEAAADSVSFNDVLKSLGKDVGQVTRSFNDGYNEGIADTTKEN